MRSPEARTVRRAFASGVVLALLLIVCVGYTIRNNLFVTGDITANGSITAGRSISGDTITASRSAVVFECFTDYGKMAVNDSGRFNKGIYLGGQQINKVLRASASLNFDLTAVTIQDLNVTATGAADGDEVFVGAPNGSVTTTVQYTGWVSAANTVTVRARTAAAGENPASGTFKVVVFK